MLAGALAGLAAQGASAEQAAAWAVAAHAQCGATLAVSRLADAHRQVQALGPLLQAHAEKPAPHTVARRMAALSADLPRQREWILRMRADTAGRHGGDEDDDEWLSWFTRRTNPLRAVFIALLLWWAWSMWS